jgi:excisionase family DNA binding protein
MEDMNRIIGIQPKTLLQFNREHGYPFFGKADRIDYESMEPLDEIQVETTLSELKRITRSHWRNHQEQYLPGNWVYMGFTWAEAQEHFDEVVYEQQLLQRLGRGILTQRPELDWVRLQEATEIFQVNYKVVNRLIGEGKLNALQFKKKHRKLIHIDAKFCRVGLEYSSRSEEDNLQYLTSRLKTLNFEPMTGRYRRWRLPPSSIERIYPRIGLNRVTRSCLAMILDPSYKHHLAEYVNERELRKYKTPHIKMDYDYFKALKARSKIIYLGRPPLRYFTTEEAAYYCRLSKLAIIKAVSSGRLTPYKTDTGKHFIFEKKDLIKFIGPSTNPLDHNKESRKTIEWVEHQYACEFTSNLEPQSPSRSFLSENEILYESWMIKRAFRKLCSVSLPFRADNLHYHNMLFPKGLKSPFSSRACQDIQRYRPEKKTRKRKIKKAG